MLLEILFGGLAAALATWYSSSYSLARITKMWAIGLLIVALIYLGFAGYQQMDAPHLLLEIIGIIVYGSFAFLSLRYGVLWLATGWILHVAWDALVHPYWAAPCAPSWYPGACLGFDLVVAAFLIWQYYAQGATTKKPAKS